MRRLAGLSNAVYRVSAPGFQTLLYRKFECLVINKAVEALIFKLAAEQSIGPPLIFSNSEYRIEGFIEARPLTIWEMRNPEILK